jgi:hypothetical protein
VINRLTLSGIRKASDARDTPFVRVRGPVAAGGTTMNGGSAL